MAPVRWTPGVLIGASLHQVCVCVLTTKLSGSFSASVRSLPPATSSMWCFWTILLRKSPSLRSASWLSTESILYAHTFVFSSSAIDKDTWYLSIMRRCHICSLEILVNHFCKKMIVWWWGKNIESLVMEIMIMPTSYARGWRIIGPVVLVWNWILGVTDIFYAGSHHFSPFSSLFQIIHNELSIPSLSAGGVMFSRAQWDRCWGPKSSKIETGHLFFYCKIEF